MRKITQEDFDARLQDRVNMVSGSIDRLIALIEQRPDLLDDARLKKVFGFLQEKVSGALMSAEAARKTFRATKVPFSLSADYEPPQSVKTNFAPPSFQFDPVVKERVEQQRELGGRLVGTKPTGVESDGVDFIEED